MTEADRPHYHFRATENRQGAIRHRRFVIYICNQRSADIAIEIANFHCIPDERRWRIANPATILIQVCCYPPRTHSSGCRFREGFLYQGYAKNRVPLAKFRARLRRAGHCVRLSYSRCAFSGHINAVTSRRLSVHSSRSVPARHSLCRQVRFGSCETRRQRRDSSDDMPERIEGAVLRRCCGSSNPNLRT